MNAQAKIENFIPMRDIPIQHKDVEGIRFAYRIATPKTSEGEQRTILFIHGWPLNGLTYEGIINRLSDKYTCIAVDLPGLGNTEWNRTVDLSPKGQSRLLDLLMQDLGFSKYAIYGNDSGGMVARYLAARVPDRVTHLMLANTEIPNQPAPGLPQLKFALKIPGFSFLLRKMLASDRIVKSSLLFGGVFGDRSLLKGDFKEDFIQPLLRSKRAFKQAIYSFNSICNWEQMNALETTHTALTMPTAFIWGEDDAFFPLESAKKMMLQFPRDIQLHLIENGKLFSHQESPEKVSQSIIEFMETQYSKYSKGLFN